MPEVVLVRLRRASRFGCCRNTGCSSICFRCPPPHSRCRPMPMRRRCWNAVLINTDERIAADKPVTPTFLFAVLLWSAVLRELNERQAGPAPDLAQLMQACDTVLRAQQSRVAIPRRFGIPMRELLMLQPRFNRRSGVKSLSLLQHPRFRAAYDFLLLRAQVGRRRSGTREVVDRHSSAAAGGARGAGAGAPGGTGWRRAAVPRPRAADAAAAGAAERRAARQSAGTSVRAGAPPTWRSAAIFNDPASGCWRPSSGWRRCPRRARCCARVCTRPARWVRRISRDFVNAAAGLLTQLPARELLDGPARHRAAHGARASGALGAAHHRSRI